MSRYTTGLATKSSENLNCPSADTQLLQRQLAAMAIDVKDFSPCPNLSKRVRELSGEEGFAYWSQLGYSQMTKDHSLCNEDECHANDLDPEKYVTKHTRDGCECTFLGPSPADLTSIYEAGSFPVVSLRTRNGLSSVHVRPYEPGLQYVAISHA
jgi:hypothetical protein